MSEKERGGQMDWCTGKHHMHCVSKIEQNLYQKTAHRSGRENTLTPSISVLLVSSPAWLVSIRASTCYHIFQLIPSKSDGCDLSLSMQGLLANPPFTFVLGFSVQLRYMWTFLHNTNGVHLALPSSCHCSLGVLV